MSEPAASNARDEEDVTRKAGAENGSEKAGYIETRS